MECKIHLQESAQQLKDQGLKITSVRLKLLDIFKHAKKPLSVKEIYKNLKSADLVTLYRNVESLEDQGLLKHIYINSKQAFYELNSSRHHHHITCVQCGKINDIAECEVKIKKGSIPGFAKVTEHSLEFFGLCNKCTK
jgi:Fe2+ or Zn2+ uptake regulation protein